MPDYRRAWHPGGTYFFTVNLLQRQGNDLLTRHIELLRAVVKSVRQRHPFTIHGWVVLPGHLHCVIELPPDDANYATCCHKGSRCSVIGLVKRCVQRRASVVARKDRAVQRAYQIR